MILNIIGLLIGIAVFAAGIYYRCKEKEDQESKKIYTITAAAGAAVILIVVIRLLMGA